MGGTADDMCVCVRGVSEAKVEGALLVEGKLQTPILK